MASVFYYAQPWHRSGFKSNFFVLNLNERTLAKDCTANTVLPAKKIDIVDAPHMSEIRNPLPFQNTYSYFSSHIHTYGLETLGKTQRKHGPIYQKTVIIRTWSGFYAVHFLWVRGCSACRIGVGRMGRSEAGIRGQRLEYWS